MIVVTRHKALIGYLKEKGIITGNEKIIEHATIEDVKGQDVIGVLPLSLAALAKSITEIPLKMDLEDRGKELSLERIRQIAEQPKTYRVFDQSNDEDILQQAEIYENALKKRDKEIGDAFCRQ